MKKYRSLKTLLKLVLKSIELNWNNSFYVGISGESTGLCSHIMLMEQHGEISSEEYVLLFEFFMKKVSNLQRENKIHNIYLFKPGLLEPRIEFLKEQIIIQ